MHSAIKAFRTRFKNFREHSREPGLTALLVVEIALIFLVVPLAGMGMLSVMFVPGMFALLVIATLLVTSRSHIAAGVVLIAVALSPFGALAHVEHPTVLTAWLSAGGRLLAIVAVSVVVARAVFGGGRVTLHRVQGAIVLYLNFGLFFFTLFRLVEMLLPSPFHFPPETPSDNGSGATMLYFSFSTLATLGYGDIYPIHPMARALANFEAIVGQLYPATLLARLVSLELEHRRQTK